LSNYGADWDLAYTEKESNSASAFVASGFADGKMYIDDVGYHYLEFPDLIAVMTAMRMMHFVENKASGISAKQTFDKMQVPAILVPVKGGDKVARANLASPYAQAGMVCIRKSVAEKLYHDSRQGILAFPNGQGNDLADALAQAVQRHFGTGYAFFVV
jgi:phage terminase large subunit-like protein